MLSMLQSPVTTPGRGNLCGSSQTKVSRFPPPLSAYSDRQPPPSTSSVPGAFESGRESEARRGIFNRIAPVYDQLNNLLSAGQHHVWKRCAVTWSRAAPGHRALDVCCGTGDLAFLLSDRVGQNGSVVGLDFAEDILSFAAQKEADRAPLFGRRSQRIEWIQGDALALPFPDRSFDAATMGYGLRNVADIPKALRELHRVLRSEGSTVAILDFNHSEDFFVTSLQSTFLDLLVVPAAKQMGLGPEYEYLKPSIARFPTGREQERLAREAGFTRAVHYELMGGLMGCLVATK